MAIRGAYHQALVEEHQALRYMRTMLFSGGLLVLMLLVVAFSLAILWMH